MIVKHFNSNLIGETKGMCLVVKSLSIKLPTQLAKLANIHGITEETL